MIGQNNFKKWVEKFKNEDNYPKCVLILGDNGMGKKTMAKYLAMESGKEFVMCGNTVDEVREVIKTVNSCNYPTYFCFPDCNKLSKSAINSLLKVIEEPPLKVSFILTANSSWNMDTIKSRCTIFYCEQYSFDELLYFTSNSRMLQYEVVPEKLLRLNSYGSQYFNDLVDFCNKIADNIRYVTGVNSLKITNKVKIKDTDNGFDLDLFFDFMCEVLSERLKDSIRNKNFEDASMYRGMLTNTILDKNDLNVTGIKKDSLLDMWVLHMREGIVF